MEIGDTMKIRITLAAGLTLLALVGTQQRAAGRPRADAAADRRSCRRRPGALLGILRSLRPARTLEDGHRRSRDVSRQERLHDEVGQGVPGRDRVHLRAPENRRGLPRASRTRAWHLKVYPLNNYGAVEVGVHRFYQLLPGKPEKLVEVSQFTHVWKKDESGWKLHVCSATTIV